MNSINEVRKGTYNRIVNLTGQKLLYNYLIIIFAGAFFACLWTGSIWGMNLTVVLLHLVCTYVQYKEKNYSCFFFYVTVFIFLLGTVFFGLFDPALKYGFVDSDVEKHVLTCLAISIIGVYVGSEINIQAKVYLGRKNRIRNEHRLQHPELQYQTVSNKMQSFLRYAFMFCAVFSIIEAVVKAIFVSANSYLSYYTDFNTPLPYIAVWLSSVSPLLFYLYLGTLPRKKDVVLPTVFYLIVGVIALFYGQRNVFVVRVFMIVCYFLMRNTNASQYEQWISKKQIGLLVLLIPVGIAFMSFWGLYRYGGSNTSNSFLETILQGLLSQGNDISILDFEYRYGDLLPQRPYALGGIISTLHNNIFARLLGVTQIPTQANTVETALNGYAFSCTLMFFENKNGYLLGYGIGSCYIAELVFSFGFIGVFIGSVLYGVILKKLSNFQFKGFIVNGILLFMLQKLLLAPRASYDGFIAGVLQAASLFVLLMCWALNRYVWPVKKNE